MDAIKDAMVKASLIGEKMPENGPIRSKIWQIFPSFCASLFGVSFGMMLGWASPTYPKLFEEHSPIPITLDQSAMIAGFLMLGNIVAIPFSQTNFLGTKYGIVLSVSIMLTGWIVMFRATNLYFLLISRLIVGVANGFGCGQLKSYIKKLCEPKVSRICLKTIHLYVFFGTIVAFGLEPLDFRNFSKISIVITFFILCLSILLPHPPGEYLRFEQPKKAQKIIQFIYPSDNLDLRISKIRTEESTKKSNQPLGSMLKDSDLRIKFLKIISLTFFQQFTGVPACIVYTQIILEQSETPKPALFSISIPIGLFLSNVVAVFWTETSRKRYVFSAITVIIDLILIIATIHLQINRNFSNYFFLILLISFVCFHSIGLGVIASNCIGTWFPEDSIQTASLFYIFFHCAFAIVSTKLFQILMGLFGLVAGFSMFLIVAITFLIFILVFIPSK